MNCGEKVRRPSLKNRTAKTKAREQGTLDRKKIRALDEALNVSEKSPQGIIGVGIMTAMEALEMQALSATLP